MNGTFLDTLRILAGGDALTELDELQEELLSTIQSRQASGQITLTVSYHPRSSRQLRLSYEVKGKAPKREREESLVFMSDDWATMYRDDPRQGKLDIDPDAPRREAVA